MSTMVEDDYGCLPWVGGQGQGKERDSEKGQNFYFDGLNDEEDEAPRTFSMFFSLFGKKSKTEFYGNMQHTKNPKKKKGASFADMGSMAQRIGVKFSRKNPKKHPISRKRLPTNKQNYANGDVNDLDDINDSMSARVTPNYTISEIGDEHLDTLESTCSEQLKALLSSLDNQHADHAATATNSSLPESAAATSGAVGILLSSENVAKYAPHPSSAGPSGDEVSEGTEDKVSLNSSLTSRSKSTMSYMMGSNGGYSYSHAYNSKYSHKNKGITRDKSLNSQNSNRSISSVPETQGGDVISNIIKICDVIVVKSEVLQLKGNYADAISCLYEGFTIVNKKFQEVMESEDSNNVHTYASHHISYFASENEFKQKKLLASIYRRLGTLYKLDGDNFEAEMNINKYIGLIEEIMLKENSIDNIKELSMAYSNLAVIYEQMGRQDKALIADKKALEYLNLISGS